MSTFNQLIEEVNRSLKSVKHVIAVLSGKGGVGKSLISASLSIALSRDGRRVALLDADVHGPSIPWILGIEDRFLGTTVDGKLVPVEVDGIAVVSLELLLEDRSAPIVWRGPLKTKTLIQLVASTLWGERDYLVVDLPPGTGDEALTIAQVLRSKLTGVILVSTPGAMVKHIVEKAKRFADMLGIPLLGVVMNMAYARCPRCGARIEIFGSIEPIEGAEVLGEVPLDPQLAKAVERGELAQYLSSDNEASKRLREIARRVEELVEKGKDSG